MKNKKRIPAIDDLAEPLKPDPVEVGDGEWYDLKTGVRLYPVVFRGRRVFVTVPEDERGKPR